MSFIAWTEIELFHNIRKFVKIDPNGWWSEQVNKTGTSTVTYRAKVKLHGSNTAVQVHPDGKLITQSRTGELSIENDYKGFTKWVLSHKDGWLNSLNLSSATGWIIYGEWCGPGIQAGVAVSDIPNKIFAVFAARLLDSTSDHLIVNPEDLKKLVAGIPDTYVLPWYGAPIDINWSATDEDLTKSTAVINDWVVAVEANDPWVEANFGVKGTGEGLVFYPVSDSHRGYKNYENLCFKAKGDKHRVIKSSVAAQVNPDVAASVDAFSNMVLTVARLEQGAQMVQIRDGSPMFNMKVLGEFIKWIVNDVQKETKDELETSKLDWKQVQKPISDKARNWYIAKAKK
jgi:hypothetical protein